MLIKNFIKLLSLSSALVLPAMAVELGGESAVSTPKLIACGLYYIIYCAIKNAYKVAHEVQHDGG